MAKGHKQTSKRVEFCRVPNCKRSNYRDVCPASWKPNQAHHLLCVSYVNKAITRKTEIKPVIDASKWCINSKTNMLAMPLWGTTVMHYCSDFSSITAGDTKGLAKALAGGLWKSKKGAPAFANIPHHNYGHSG